MVDNKDQDRMLEGLFDAARQEPAEPSPELLARVLADAEAEQARHIASPPVQVVPERGFFAGLLAGIGGWPSAAGLAAATLAGIWIGFSAPDTVDELASGVFNMTQETELIDLMPTLDALLLEG